MILRLLLSVVLLCTLPVSLLAQQAEGFSIDTISDAVFQRMQGRSFPADCTVMRQELRHLHVLHRNAQDSTERKDDHTKEKDHTQQAYRANLSSYFSGSAVHVVIISFTILSIIKESLTWQ